ncbi:MAG: phosphoribosylglycinamide formyltransferase [Acidobacteria bacterium]|nr:phosphoribosylglycinamide formyltransferase [Acidobacteriota bacterium]
MGERSIVILASGSGTLAQALIDAIIRAELDCEISAIISDQRSQVLERARKHDITNFYLPLTKVRTDWDEKLLDLVSKLKPDLVISAGFMRILSPDFVAKFDCINSHPSLLPAFPGAHAVRDALAAGVSETGCTVHWIDAGIDTGAIIGQIPMPIYPTDSEETLHERIKIAERALIVETVSALLADKY